MTPIAADLPMEVETRSQIKVVITEVRPSDQFAIKGYYKASKHQCCWLLDGKWQVNPGIAPGDLILPENFPVHARKMPDDPTVPENQRNRIWPSQTAPTPTPVTVYTKPVEPKKINPKIKLGGWYRTNSGKLVQITTIDPKAFYPVKGRMQGRTYDATYDEEGCYTKGAFQHDDTLILERLTGTINPARPVFRDMPL